MAYVALTKSEEKLMRFLWEQGVPLSASEIQALWKDNGWTKTYTRDIIRVHPQRHYRRQIVPGRGPCTGEKRR